MDKLYVFTLQHREITRQEFAVTKETAKRYYCSKFIFDKSDIGVVSGKALDRVILTEDRPELAKAIFVEELDKAIADLKEQIEICEKQKISIRNMEVK